MPQVTTNQKTDQTRAWADQVEKLQWLYKLKGITSADFIGPIIAKKLDAAYAEIEPLVEQIKASNDVGGEGG